MRGSDYLAVDEGYSQKKQSCHHNTVLVDGKGQYREGVYNVADGLGIDWGGKLEAHFVGRAVVYARGEAFEVDHLLGADLLVRREASEQVGWLDAKFFIYCEEIDWCMRIKRAGWQIWCVPQAEIVHHEAQSTRQFRDRMFVELWRARKRLFEKHYSRAFRFAARQIARAGLWNETRKARAAARSGLVTQDELKKRLDAYAQVRHNVIGTAKR